MLHFIKAIFFSKVVNGLRLNVLLCVVIKITVEPFYNTDTKGTRPKCLYYRGVRIKRLSDKKVTDTCFIVEKTKADIFYGNKIITL